MDAYGVYKEFGEVLKTPKYSKLPDQEIKCKIDDQTEVDLKHTEEQKVLNITSQCACFVLNHE